MKLKTTKDDGPELVEHACMWYHPSRRAYNQKGLINYNSYNTKRLI